LRKRRELRTRGRDKAIFGRRKREKRENGEKRKRERERG